MESAADAYNALKSYNAPTAQSVLSQAQNQAGVGQQQTRVSDIRNTVNNLQSSLNAVDPSVTGRTSGTFTTEGQRQALVNKEQAPIQSNLSSENNNLNTAQGDLTSANNNASTIASAIMSQNQQQYQKLLDQYNAASAYEQNQRTLAQQQAEQAEKVREFNAQLEASKASNSSGNVSGVLSALLGGSSAKSTQSSTQSTLTGGKTVNDAANALKQLLSTKNSSTIRNTIGAIQKSASYGNTYDQAKLQLINSRPEFKQYLANFNGATF